MSRLSGIVANLPRSPELEGPEPEESTSRLSGVVANLPVAPNEQGFTYQEPPQYDPSISAGVSIPDPSSPPMPMQAAPPIANPAMPGPQFPSGTPADVRDTRPDLFNKERPALPERAVQQFMNRFILEDLERARPSSNVAESMGVLAQTAESLGEPQDYQGGSLLGELWHDTKQVGKFVYGMNKAYFSPEKTQEREGVHQALEKERGSYAIQVPQPEGLGEKVTDVGAGLSAFLARLYVAKKIVPKEVGTLHDALAWEVESRASGGLPGEGAAMSGTLKTLGKLRKLGKMGAAGELGAESALFASLAASQGGELEDVIIAALLPPALRLSGVVRAKAKSMLAGKSLVETEKATSELWRMREQALSELGLPSNATESQIKKAYRAKSHQTHPDIVGTGREAEFANATDASNFLHGRTSEFKPRPVPPPGSAPEVAGKPQPGAPKDAPQGSSTVPGPTIPEKTSQTTSKKDKPLESEITPLSEQGATEDVDWKPQWEEVEYGRLREGDIIRLRTTNGGEVVGEFKGNSAGSVDSAEAAVAVIGNHRVPLYRIKSVEREIAKTKPTAEESAVVEKPPKAIAATATEPEGTGANKTIAEIDRQVKWGTTSKGTARLAKQLIKTDPDFDANDALMISGEVMAATDEIIEAEGLTKYNADGTKKKYGVMGFTFPNLESSATRTAIQLYRGHDADTLVEEWYHRAWYRLSPQKQAVYRKYHVASEDGRSVEEHYGQEGRDFHFGRKLHETAGPIRELFAGARKSLRALIQRIRTLRGAKIPKEIEEMYQESGTGVRKPAKAAPMKAKAIDSRAVKANVSFQVRDIDPKSITNEEWSKISRHLKRQGYDVRGAKDVKGLFDKNPTIFEYQPDWQKAYKAAKGEPIAKGPAPTGNIDRKRIKKLGTTTNIAEAGYLTTTGTYIDLSGKREGGPHGERSYDHREAGGTNGMLEYMNLGNIRLLPESGGIDLMQLPNAKQLSKLTGWIGQHNGEVMLDLQDGLGDYDKHNEYYQVSGRRTNVEFQAGTKPIKVIGIIKRFYAGEEIKPGPSFQIREEGEEDDKKISRPKYKDNLESWDDYYDELKEMTPANQELHKRDREALEKMGRKPDPMVPPKDEQKKIAKEDVAKAVFDYLEGRRSYKKDKWIKDIKQVSVAKIEEIWDSWWYDRDVAAMGINGATDALQQELAVAAGIKKINAKTTRELKRIDAAVQLYIDLKGKEAVEIDKFYADLTPDQQGLVDESQNLPPAIKKFAEKIINLNYQAGLEKMSAGMIQNVVDNYTMRLWGAETQKINPKKKRQHGRHQKFEQETDRSEERLYSSILQGWADGKELWVKGATTAYQAAHIQVEQAQADRYMVKAALEQGVFKTAKDKGQDWIQLVHPHLGQWSPVGELTSMDDELRSNNFMILPEDAGKRDALEWQPLFAEPKLARKLNNALGRSTLDGWAWDSLSKWNMILKHNVLFTSLFHHQAFIRSYVLGGKTGIRGLVDPIGTTVKGYRAGRAAIQRFDGELQEIVGAGLTVGRTQDWDESIWQHQTTMIGRFLDKIPVAGPIKKKIMEFREVQNKFLFQKLGPFLKVQGALLEYRHLKHKYRKRLEAGTITNEKLAKMVANLYNDDFGGLHLQRMGRNPTTQHIGRLLLLAPDWTESNIRSMAKAFKLGEEGKMYRDFWFRIALKGLTATMIANFLLSLKDDDNFIERYKKAWKTGYLRWLDVDVTPIYQALGGDDEKRKYFSIMGHFRDPLKFIRHPLISLKHKSSIVLKMAMEAISGSDWAGRQYTTLAELLGVDDKGEYKTTQKGKYEKGDPKGGKLQGQTVKWSPTGMKPLSYERVPSFLLNQIRSTQPIQVQNAIAFLAGEIDAFDMLTKSAGLMTFSTYEPEPEEEVIEAPAKKTYRNNSSQKRKR